MWLLLGHDERSWAMNAEMVVIAVYHYEGFILHWTVLVIRRIKWILP